MANMKNAKKKVSQIAKVTPKNHFYTSTVKNIIRNTDKMINAGNKEEAKINLDKAIKSLDKASAKGVIHQNKANREKSRLTLKVNAMQ